MKKPLFSRRYDFESAATYTEDDGGGSAKLCSAEVEDVPVRECLEAMSHMSYAELLKWLSRRPVRDEVVRVVPIAVHTEEMLRQVATGDEVRMLLLMRPLHTIERLNDFLFAANECLPQGGWMWVHVMTAGLKRKILMEKYPRIVGSVACWAHYFVHRVLPKLWLTRGLYARLNKGRDMTYSRVEVVGRIYRAGFAVVDEGFRDGEYLLTLRKTGEPKHDIPPTGSPIVKLRRVGLDGKVITVLKFRTMHTYSEYMQPYIYQQRQLDKGGKFKMDYRVSSYGAVLRKVWLDELPMVWNIVRGDMKLVGVRPLSQQYFSLYTPEMQALRVKVKPGLLPPFYYDDHTPETIDEVQASERRYIEAYLQKPFATDWRYFWGIMGNIIVRRKRSK